MSSYRYRVWYRAEEKPQRHRIQYAINATSKRQAVEIAQYNCMVIGRCAEVQRLNPGANKWQPICRYWRDREGLQYIEG